MRLQHLFGELKRRHVFRVVGAYGLAAWLVIEIAATTFPLLGIGDWAATFVLVLALLGFPIVFVLAWVFDITPHGIERTAARDALAPHEQDIERQGMAAAASPAIDEARPGRRRPPTYVTASGFLGLGILVALVSFAAFHFADPSLRAGAAGGPRDGGRSDARIQSIAVLPFSDMSAGGDQTYFSDGIAEELLNRLAMIDGLHVAARTSSFAFRGSPESIERIGAALRVEAVLEGSVRRDGDRVRIMAQLVNARTGYRIWSQNFDRDVSDIFAVQDEIATGIVDALRLHLAMGDAPTERSGTAVTAALDPYLAGMARLHERTDAELLLAVRDFERAIAADPDYALAHAALAQTYALLPALGAFPAGDAIPKGFAAAARALALDPMLPEANAALGHLSQNFEWDFDAAESAYRRALAVNPGYATAHQWYAETLLILGRADEAAASVERALALDPLSPAALATKAYSQLVRGDADGALATHERLATLAPGYRRGHWQRALAALAAARFDVAAHAFAQASSDASATAAFEALTRALASGDAAAARAHAATAAGALPGSLGALVYAAAGDRAGAVARLEQAAVAHTDLNLPLVLTHPLLRPLAADAGVQRVREQVLRTGG